MRKQQMYANSCGAASLLCAAGELGVTRLPEIAGSMCSGQSLAANGACETSLYQITSGATTGRNPAGRDLSKAGYSMPHNMVLAARLLGLDARVYMDGRLAAAIAWAYPECRSITEQSGVRVLQTPPPPLDPNQRLLKVLGVMKVAGLHYVMQRPTGSYMDPNDGRDYDNFDEMNNSWLKSYADTGISILVSSSEQSASAQRAQALKVVGTSKEAPF